ncbi:hypothetical protein GGR56DRAFT_62579 [Xylariaceae sp. FL0804]|nr:hypothetical protein GGR56DRAFT_62579 [Xylariaceae sp. FL0804]
MTACRAAVCEAACPWLLVRLTSASPHEAANNTGPISKGRAKALDRITSSFSAMLSMVCSMAAQRAAIKPSAASELPVIGCSCAISRPTPKAAGIGNANHQSATRTALSFVGIIVISTLAFAVVLTGAPSRHRRAFPARVLSRWWWPWCEWIVGKLFPVMV